MMADLLKGGRKVIIFIVLFCIAGLSILLLTNAFADNEINKEPINESVNEPVQGPAITTAEPENSSVDSVSSEPQSSEQAKPQKQETLDEAVSRAILDQRKNYGAGEANTEGHVILDSEEKDGVITVYTVSSFGAFGFENGVFTKVSGSGAIPTVFTLAKNENSYAILGYKEPQDGSGYTSSIKKMFPRKLWDKVLTTGNYTELAKQQEEQAKLYLQSIGRDAEVSEKYVEKKLPEINVDASNKLFAEYTKYDEEFNRFPYWLGTREFLDNGVRYIYETSLSKTDDSYDLMTYQKKTEDGSVVLEYKYKIVGSEPQLVK